MKIWFAAIVLSVSAVHVSAEMRMSTTLSEPAQREENADPTPPAPRPRPAPRRLELKADDAQRCPMLRYDVRQSVGTRCRLPLRTDGHRFSHHALAPRLSRRSIAPVEEPSQPEATPAPTQAAAPPKRRPRRSRQRTTPDLAHA